MKKLFVIIAACMFFLMGAKEKPIYIYVQQHYKTDASRLKAAQLRASMFRASIDYSYLDATSKKAILSFFAESRLDVLETAVMEEIKFGIPAEIKIAQAILETGYGRKVSNKNWFGIKSKNGTTTTTKEHLTSSQMKGLTILSKTYLGDDLYECIVVDSFREYSSDWSSWRHHSMYIMTAKNPKNPTELLYGFLFSTDDYRIWAYGLQGKYATDKDYAKKLIKIIKKYKLYLL